MLLVACVVVVALVAAGLLRRALTSDEDAVLSVRLDVVDTLLDAGDLQAALQANDASLGNVQIVDAAGDLLASTPGLGADIRLAGIDVPVGRQVAETVSGEDLGVTGGTYRVLIRREDSPLGPLAIVGLSPVSAAHNAERHLRNAVLLSIPVLLVVAGWFMHLVIGRALAPVEAMRAEVERFQVTDLSLRVPARSDGDEVARLGDTLNGLLERLADAAARQELFAASASHELRSPLSAVRTELEVGLAYPDKADWPRVAEDCLLDITRLEQLARDLRTLTRSQRASSTTMAEVFDLDVLVRDELNGRRSNHTIAVSPAAGPAEVFANREGVVRVVRNLLDNAERHARSEIRVSVRSTDGGVALRVGNDGEPIPAEATEFIFDAFTRLDEARSLDSGGSGLGLAIARKIMETDGGKLSASLLEEGAEFVAWFPPLAAQLPIADGRSANRSPLRPPSAPASSPSPGASGRR